MNSWLVVSLSRGLGRTWQYLDVGRHACKDFEAYKNRVFLICKPPLPHLEPTHLNRTNIELVPMLLQLSVKTKAWCSRSNNFNRLWVEQVAKQDQQFFIKEGLNKWLSIQDPLLLPEFPSMTPSHSCPENLCKPPHYQYAHHRLWCPAPASQHHGWFQSQKRKRWGPHYIQCLPYQFTMSTGRVKI